MVEIREILHLSEAAIGTPIIRAVRNRGALGAGWCFMEVRCSAA
jgi:hypothetical protein